MPARKPTAVLQLTGAFDKNPSRRRARAAEPEPNGQLGEPPAHLPQSVAACWREITDLACPGVLCKSDRLVVEHAARLLAILREKKWRVAPAVWLRFEATLSRLGLSPVDRARVTATKQPGGDAGGFEF